MRKLKLTSEEIQKYTEEFQQMLQKAKSVVGGKINMEMSVGKMKDPPEEEKAKVVFTPVAWLKTIELVFEFSSEVAWHYICRRDEEDPRKFILEDVLVYPQKVASATVEIDEVTYAKWKNDIDDDTFFKIRGQGHSHVNMGVGASTTDTEHQRMIVSQLNDDSENPFYIFVIINKKHDIHFDVYDIENNVVYENKDVKYYIYDVNSDIVGFINDAKDLVKKEVAVKKYGSTYTGAKNYGGVKKVLADDDKWDNFKNNLYYSDYDIL